MFVLLASSLHTFSRLRTAAYARAFALQSLLGITPTEGAEARVGMTRGQIAYEADCAARPTYHDGKPRRSWEQLDDLMRNSWEANPTPRTWSAPSPTEGEN